MYETLPPVNVQSGVGSGVLVAGNIVGVFVAGKGVEVANKM